MYEIVDRHTGKVVGRARTLAGARRSVDRRDCEYGAYRFYAREEGAARAARFGLDPEQAASLAEAQERIIRGR